MSPLGGFGGMIPGEFCQLGQLIAYFDASLPSEN